MLGLLLFYVVKSLSWGLYAAATRFPILLKKQDPCRPEFLSIEIITNNIKMGEKNSPNLTMMRKKYLYPFMKIAIIRHYRLNDSFSEPKYIKYTHKF